MKSPSDRKSIGTGSATIVAGKQMVDFGIEKTGDVERKRWNQKIYHNSFENVYRDVCISLKEEPFGRFSMDMPERY